MIFSKDFGVLGKKKNVFSFYVAVNFVFIEGLKWFLIVEVKKHVSNLGGIYINTSFTVLNFSLVYLGVFLLEFGPKMS